MRFFFKKRSKYETFIQKHFIIREKWNIYLRMESYLPEKLPLKTIDWERHVPNIAQANSHLARFDNEDIT